MTSPGSDLPCLTFNIESNYSSPSAVLIGIGPVF
jgi:hypothetical protein